MEQRRQPQSGLSKYCKEACAKGASHQGGKEAKQKNPKSTEATKIVSFCQVGVVGAPPWFPASLYFDRHDICWAHADLQQAGPLIQQSHWSRALPEAPNAISPQFTSRVMEMGRGRMPLGWMMKLAEAEVQESCSFLSSPPCSISIAFVSPHPPSCSQAARHSRIPLLPLLAVLCKAFCKLGNGLSG